MTIEVQNPASATNTTGTTTRELRPVQRDPLLNPAYHRRILSFLNQAVSPEDLMYEKIMVVHTEGGLVHQGNLMHEDNPDAMKMTRRPIMNRETATRLLELREIEYP